MVFRSIFDQVKLVLLLNRLGCACGQVNDVETRFFFRVDQEARLISGCRCLLYSGIFYFQKTGSSVPDNSFAGDSVIGEELQNKIEENARLHKQVLPSPLLITH